MYIQKQDLDMSQQSNIKENINHENASIPSDATTSHTNKSKPKSDNIKPTIGIMLCLLYLCRI